MAVSEYIKIEFTKKQAVCAALGFVIFSGVVLYDTWLSGYYEATAGTEPVVNCSRPHS